MHSRKPQAEIPQDIAFHHRLWVVQRVGWIVALLIIALALGGLFGGGPLSDVRAGDAALTIEYDRFMRRDSPTEIRIDAQPSAENEIRIAFTRDYIHEMRVDSILPYPQRVETLAGEVLFVFRIAPQARSARITINAMPLHVGSLQGRVRIVGDANAPSIPLDQFVWP
jgi:hypothetical protein